MFDLLPNHSTGSDPGHSSKPQLPMTFTSNGTPASPPASGVSSPASGVSSPASGVPPPASGVASPASGVSSPASGVSPPASGVSSPASGVSPPASGVSSPASGSPAPASGVSSPAPASGSCCPGSRDYSELEPPQATTKASNEARHTRKNVTASLQLLEHASRTTFSRIARSSGATPPLSHSTHGFKEITVITNQR